MRIQPELTISQQSLGYDPSGFYEGDEFANVSGFVRAGERRETPEHEEAGIFLGNS